MGIGLSFIQLVYQLALPKPTSDNCPILLDSRKDSWGPPPFRLEMVWLEENYFPNLVQEWWADILVHGWAGYRWATKLKILKDRNNDWSIFNNGRVSVLIASLLNGIKKIDRRRVGQYC